MRWNKNKSDITGDTPDKLGSLFHAVGFLKEEHFRMGSGREGVRNEARQNGNVRMNITLYGCYEDWALYWMWQRLTGFEYGGGLARFRF